MLFQEFFQTEENITIIYNYINKNNMSYYYFVSIYYTKLDNFISKPQ
ncbi:hypothetical protein AB837_00426 [bacterium AB1]|nr:hypothetical protein AB837_00426 [bacterium AB1]